LRNPQQGSIFVHHLQQPLGGLSFALDDLLFFGRVLAQVRPRLD